MPDKFTRLDPRGYAYILDHSTPPDALTLELIEETESLGAVSAMQIAPDQAALLAMLTRLTGARRAVEVGTFTGLSALAVARALPDDGHLLCCDVNEEWTSIARRYWERAGVAAKITLRIAPAAETLRALPADETIDLAFIDADKSGYLDYYEQILSRLRSGGLIVMDNVLWGGRVADPDADDKNTAALRAFNDFIVADPRVDAVMVPVSDGLSLIRKR